MIRWTSWLSEHLRRRLDPQLGKAAAELPPGRGPVLNYEMRPRPPRSSARRRGGGGAGDGGGDNACRSGA